ncbi:MAG: divalent-cation tolerance protein CutA [Candidatus Tectimicrobiota bacterium]|nr:MAG: divalent-cation tolerance protein CutA [Candidatus Tectomicrobia bacterium]
MASCLVLSTLNDRQRAETIALTLVEERLVACVNIVGPALSVYHWQGKIERDEEYVLLMKTATSLTERLMARLQQLHPYEVPEILVLPIAAGAAAYLDWIARTVQSAP